MHGRAVTKTRVGPRSRPLSSQDRLKCVSRPVVTRIELYVSWFIQAVYQNPFNLSCGDMTGF